MERITDLLARKVPQFNTAATHCLVSDALYKMCCENVDFLIVLDDDSFRGIITDHDIASKILFEDRPLNKIEVTEFMNTNLPVATPAATLQEAMKLMERYNVRHLAVYDNFEFKGVISSHDLMQEALNTHSELFKEEEGSDSYHWYY